MGGRGANSGISGNRFNSREDKEQMNDAKLNGLRQRAKYYEYTDKNGKVHKGETGNLAGGGTYRAKYSEQVSVYAKMATEKLKSERKALKDISDENYQKFTRAAASRSGSMVEKFGEADKKIKMIDQVLRRRNNKRNEKN